jgi:twitching motility protein PilT
MSPWFLILSKEKTFGQRGMLLDKDHGLEVRVKGMIDEKKGEPMHINDLLKMATEQKASDLHLKVGSAPIIRVDGTLKPLTQVASLMQEDTVNMAFSILNGRQKQKFKENHEIDVAYSVPGLGRFRCNIFQQRNTVGLVLRVIPVRILTVRELMLPVTIERICHEQRGMVLVTGTTGSGKSTTLAGMIDFVNANRVEHIMTIEDPIEFLHRDKKSIVNQREVDVDTHSFSTALRSALRQDPDVILVGEMRDKETIETALNAAETGHLVLSTLHTLDATETINRIISVFPPHQQKQIRLQLAGVLKAIISMRLVPRVDNKGRVPAVEVLVNTAYIKSCIEEKEKTKLIHDAIASGASQYGMQTFDQSLYYLWRNKLITYEEALKRASNPDDFKLRVQGIQSTSDMAREAMESSIDSGSRVHMDGGALDEMQLDELTVTPRKEKRTTVGGGQDFGHDDSVFDFSSEID